MSIIGLIPARGGSKSIKNKNIVKFLGKPLLSHVADSAKKSKHLKHIICSTDDKNIIRVCENINVNVQVRPASLSQDDTNIVDVIKFVIKKLKKDNIEAKIIVLLQPTYPFVKTKIIDESIELLIQKKKIASVQSVTEVPHCFHAYNQRKIIKSEVSFFFEKERTSYYSKQKKINLFSFGNLTSFKVEKFFEQKTCFPKPSFPINISRLESFDIDNEEDLKIARRIFE